MFKLCAYALAGNFPGGEGGGGEGAAEAASRASSGKLTDHAPPSVQADEVAVSTVRSHLALFKSLSTFGPTANSRHGTSDDASLHCRWLVRQHVLFGLLLERRAARGPRNLS